MMSCNGSRGQVGGSAQCMALETVIPASLLAPLKNSWGNEIQAGCLNYVVWHGLRQQPNRFDVICR